jgi:hypothetical protein
MGEAREWERRRAALAAGEPWDESTAVSVNGTALYGAEAQATIASGAAVHCGTCSSPHQKVCHDNPHPR